MPRLNTCRARGSPQTNAAMSPNYLARAKKGTMTGAAANVSSSNISMFDITDSSGGVDVLLASGARFGAA